MSHVSVVIPNFNNAAWLPRVIQSCMEQEFLLEIIVVDDHSTDHSVAVLQRLAEQHPKLRVFTNPSKGGNPARVFGFEQSRGDYIQWLDSDDFLLPGKFRLQLEYLAKHPETDIVYSDWQMDFYEDGKCQRSEPVSRGEYADALLELLRNRRWNVPCAYLCRREMVIRTIAAQGWSPDAVCAQDREFFTKAAILGARFRYAPGSTCIYNRWNAGTVSNIRFEKGIEQSFRLNRTLFDLIKVQSHLPAARKKTYEKVLNSELLTGVFYHPFVKLNRAFSLFRLDWGVIHWKIRSLIPFLYVWKQVEYALESGNLGREAREKREK